MQHKKISVTFSDLEQRVQDWAHQKAGATIQLVGTPSLGQLKIGYHTYEPVGDVKMTTTETVLADTELKNPPTAQEPIKKQYTRSETHALHHETMLSSVLGAHIGVDIGVEYAKLGASVDTSQKQSEKKESTLTTQTEAKTEYAISPGHVYHEVQVKKHCVQAFKVLNVRISGNVTVEFDTPVWAYDVKKKKFSTKEKTNVLTLPIKALLQDLAQRTMHKDWEEHKGGVVEFAVLHGQLEWEELSYKAQVTPLVQSASMLSNSFPQDASTSSTTEAKEDITGTGIGGKAQLKGPLKNNVIEGVVPLAPERAVNLDEEQFKKWERYNQSVARMGIKGTGIGGEVIVEKEMEGNTVIGVNLNAPVPQTANYASFQPPSSEATGIGGQAKIEGTLKGNRIVGVDYQAISPPFLGQYPPSPVQSLRSSESEFPSRSPDAEEKKALKGPRNYRKKKSDVVKRKGLMPRLRVARDLLGKIDLTWDTAQSLPSKELQNRLQTYVEGLSAGERQAMMGFQGQVGGDIHHSTFIGKMVVLIQHTRTHLKFNPNSDPEQEKSEVLGTSSLKKTPS